MKKISLRPQNFKIFEILDLIVLKYFPIKNHLAFLTIEIYDMEQTNIKILDKNIVPPGGVQALKEDCFYR